MHITLEYKGKKINADTYSINNAFGWLYRMDNGPLRECTDRPLHSAKMMLQKAIDAAKREIDSSAPQRTIEATIRDLASPLRQHHLSAVQGLYKSCRRGYGRSQCIEFRQEFLQRRILPLAHATPVPQRTFENLPSGREAFVRGSHCLELHVITRTQTLCQHLCGLPPASG